MREGGELECIRKIGYISMLLAYRWRIDININST